MLGSACMEIMGHNSEIELVGTARSGNDCYIAFDARTDSIDKLLESIKPNWIINCIGIIKPHIDEKITASIENAIQVNSEFPILLASAAENISARTFIPSPTTSNKKARSVPSILNVEVCEARV